MMKNRKTVALVFIALALLSFIALSSGLSDVRTDRPRLVISPGTLGENDADAEAAPEPLDADDGLSEQQKRTVVSTVIALGILAFGYFLWRVRHMPAPEQQTSVIRSFVILAGFIVLALFIDKLDLSLFGAQNRSGFVQFITPSAVAGFTISSVIFLGLFAIIYVTWYRRQPSPLDQLVAEAEDAIEALEKGDDLRHAIITCYINMCDALRSEKRIERREAMTASEFALGLEAAGIAGTEVNRLTRLFETVRYGGALGQAFGKKEEKEAIDCLRAIIQSAQRHQHAQYEKRQSADVTHQPVNQ